jgi:5-oxoprolinase (ATP-hydrolysing) subunit A
MPIQLAVDYGEAVTAEELAREWELTQYVSAINIACGGHAGDDESMRECVAAALSCGGIAIGAHPSYIDREHFGRRALDVPLDQLRSDLIAQLTALKRATDHLHTHIDHIKPHGALYHAAATERQIAEVMIEAALACRLHVAIVGPPGSALLAASRDAGLPTLREAFVDRRYEPDGSLTPRERPNALITDPAEAVEQARRIVEQGEVLTTGGTAIPMPADVLCLHGDHEQALPIAVAVSHALKNMSRR